MDFVKLDRVAFFILVTAAPSTPGISLAHRAALQHPMVVIALWPVTTAVLDGGGRRRIVAAR